MIQYAVVFSGLGLFLSGLHLLAASIKPFAGKQLRSLMSKLTGGYLSAALSGALLGAITNSTSAATFICMGLVNSGALVFDRALSMLAWSSVGGSLIVFLVAIDIRLAGLVLVGIVGISHLFNIDQVERAKNIVAILFALGLLFLGLGMIKESAYLLNQSPWGKEFIEFAAETSIICLMVGLMLTMITQSASTVTILAIALVITGIISFHSAVIFVFGANIGSGVSLLLVTSHLNGLQKQLAFFQFLSKLCGTLGVALIYLVFPDLANFSAQITSNSSVAYQLSVIYLALQISGAMLVSIGQKPILKQLKKIFPESEQESLSKPKYIYPEAIQDSNIALSLVDKEQQRIFSRLSQYLDTVRQQSGQVIPLQIRHETNLQLMQSIKQFIDEIAQQELGDQIRTLIELQSRQEAMLALIQSLYSFTQAVSEIKQHHTGISAATVEGLHLVLNLLEENINTDEHHEILLELTSDRSSLMDNIRNNLMAENHTHLSERKALFISTRIFERVLWQIRQILKQTHKN